MRAAITLCTALLFLLAAPLAHAEVDPQVLRLPVLSQINDLGETKIVVRGHLSAKRASKMVRLARSVYRHATSHYLPSTEPVDRPDVQLCLFERRDDYLRFVDAVFGEGDHSEWGFYRGDKRLVVINLQASVGNLRHELIHPLVHDNYNGAPSWLNEGLGSLYGSSSPKRGNKFNFRLNYRVLAPQQALREGTLPTFEELTHSGRDELYGDRSAVYYGMSRYLLLYLERSDQLVTFFRRMRASDGDGDTHQEIVEDLVDYNRFTLWLGKQRYRRGRAGR